MSSFTVGAAARVNAPARRVYDMIADYRNGHPRIVPPKYFTSLDVEEGGVGDGTVIRFTMRVLGSPSHSLDACWWRRSCRRGQESAARSSAGSPGRCCHESTGMSWRCWRRRSSSAFQEQFQGV